MFLIRLFYFMLLFAPMISWGKPVSVKDWISAQELDPQTTHLQITSLQNTAKNWKWNQAVDLDHVLGKKILIAAQLLEEFPPGYQFETILEGPTAVTKGETLSVPFVCLKLSKDPWFDSERMWFLVNEFTRTQIQSIQSDFYIDPDFQFSKAELMKGSVDPLDRWIRDHLENRKIEMKGKVVWKKCPSSPTPLQPLAKSPSRSTVALLNDLMSSADPTTVARFEKIFLSNRKESISISRVFEVLTKTLSESRFFPEFAGSLPILTSSSVKTMRGMLTEDQGLNILVGFFSQDGELFSIVMKSTIPASKQKKKLNNLDYSLLTANISPEGKK